MKKEQVLCFVILLFLLIAFAEGQTEGAQNFTLIVLPDTQNYADSEAYAFVFTSQTKWIADNINNSNIAFVTHLGDIVDNGGDATYWGRANESLSVLDKGNVPYSVLPGNHDDQDGADRYLNFNSYFPLGRFSDKPWWGGSMDGTMKNTYYLFSAEGQDYILISLQYNPGIGAVEWAYSVLKNYPDRRAIISTHAFLNENEEWSYGLTNFTYIWDGLVVPNPNVFLVLSGHMINGGEANRTDYVDERVVHQLLSNYQTRANGGNGFLRKMVFTFDNKIYVYTYSPWLNETQCQNRKITKNSVWRENGCYENDSNSEFVLDIAKGYSPLCQENCGQEDDSGGFCPITDKEVCGKCGNFHCNIYVDSNVAVNGRGSLESPFKTIQEGINAARRGAVILVKDGVYFESLYTQMEGSVDNRILLKAQNKGRVIVNTNGRVLYINHPYISFEGIVFDGQFADADLIILDDASHTILRDIEVKNARRDCIDMTYSINRYDILIENSKIHHCLNGNETLQADAHGITGSRARNLTIRNTEIYYVSGDAVQFDPDRMASPWSINIENSNFWTGPLPEDVLNFTAGSVPGENAFDSKHNYATDLERSIVIIKNSTFHGWRNNPLISNEAALNLKENVTAIIDGNTFYNNEIALRLRGPAGGRGGANVTVMNNVIYDNDKAIRYEDKIENLHIYGNTFGLSNIKFLESAGGYGSGFEVLNNLFVFSSKPIEAGDFSNLALSDGFVDLQNNNYHLNSSSSAIDAGKPVAELGRDRGGITRPQGIGHDVGAYEFEPLLEIYCGNGRSDSGEECDQGNEISGDGCSNNCVIEEGWECNGEPSICSFIAMPLIAPTGLVVSLVDGIVRLNWKDNSDNEEGFVIEKSGDGETWVEIGRVGENVESWSEDSVAFSPLWNILGIIKNMFRKITGYFVQGW